MGLLIAGGDSLIYGSELKDGNESPSQSTWPALIAKEIGMNYYCAAYPGFANSSIRRTVIDACENNTDVELVIVQWTFSGRYEFYFNNDYAKWSRISAWSVTDDLEKEIKKNFKANNPIVLDQHLKFFERQKELGISEFAKVFYQHVGSSFQWEQYNLLSEIVMLQQYLELRNIPYMFTAADEKMFRDISSLNDESVATLEKLLDKTYWTWFPKKQGFYNWAVSEKFPFGTTHPLEESHVEAAHIAYEHLRYIGRLS